MAEKFHSDDWDKKYNEWQEKKKKVRNEPKKDSAILNKSEPIIKKPSKEANSMRKFEDTLELKRGPRWEKIVIIAIYGIVFLIALYLILASLFPRVLPFDSNIYSIQADDSNINIGKEFYIDSNVLGEKRVIENKTVRLISAKPFNLIFTPKVNIPAGTNALLSLNLIFVKGTSNIYVNDKLIFPNLDNYKLVYETDQDYVYASKSILTNKGLSKMGSSENFIYNNFPGASVWSTRKLEPVDIKLSDYTNNETLINTTFRDNLKLAVYAEGTLDVKFTKQDLNWYLGQDEYNVSITNSAGKVIFTEVYGDDGDKLASNKLGKEQGFEIKIVNLNRSVYYVSFVKDGYNSAADSTLKNIQINSNKILIVGAFLPTVPMNLYTKVDSNKSIGFEYWLDGKSQKVRVNNFVINLDKSWINKKYTQNLSSGEYNLSLEKGYLWVYSEVISPKKENWFNLPLNEQESFDNQNILVLDKNVIKGNNLSYNYLLSINGKTTKIKARILDDNKVYLESVNLKVN